MLFSNRLVAAVALHSIAALGASFNNRESDFCFDADTAHPGAWMAKLPDKANIASLSIPGTHETMTHKVGGDGHLQCQNLDLGKQLEGGVRFVDIRTRLHNGKLHNFHAEEDTGYSFEQTMDTMVAFLEKNPSEAIIMRLRHERLKNKKNGEDRMKSTKDFEKAVCEALAGPKVKEHIWKYKHTDPLPTLGQLRSRILIVQNFKTEEQQSKDAKATHPWEGEGNLGVAWHGERTVVQDEFNIKGQDGKFDMEKKSSLVQKALEKAATSPVDNSILYVSALNVAVNIWPIDAAAGVKGTEGLNEKTTKWIVDHKNDAKLGPSVGIVVFDFPGRKAVEAVIAWNERLVKNSGSSVPSTPKQSSASSHHATSSPSSVPQQSSASRHHATSSPCTVPKESSVATSYCQSTPSGAPVPTVPSQFRNITGGCSRRMINNGLLVLTGFALLI